MQRQLLCSPMNPLTPQTHPKTRSLLFVGWVALLMGFTAALRGGGGCKNLGLIILEVLYNLNDSTKKRRTRQQ